MVRYLNAIIINEGDINIRRVKFVIFCVRSISYMLEYFRVGFLLVIFVDRFDVLVVVCLVVMNGVEIGVLLLIGGYEMDARIFKLCERVFVIGLSVFMVNINIWQIFLSLQSFNLEVSVDDYERIEKVQEYVVNYINVDWIEFLIVIFERSRRLFSFAFRYQLIEFARKAGKRIVLSEGDESRIVKVVVICVERGIVICVLLGNSVEINRVVAFQGVELGVGIEIVDLEVVRESYVGRLVELRKNKGMIEIVVREQLEDNVVFGTLMLEQDEVDGLVFGVVYIIVNIIRSSLQLIKIVSGSFLVFFVFFMLLSEQVYVYGDCAINSDSIVEQLVEIAIQFVDFVAVFGIESRVVMFFYFIGIFGVGSDVEKVREVIRLAQEKRFDLMIDGSLQYDVAVMVDVAKFKASNFSVVGRVIVFIFSDLNIGNIIYKAVQRFVDLIFIGSMLQGMRKSVNDLFRGVLVDDIVYIIALIAIQFVQQQ